MGAQDAGAVSSGTVTAETVPVSSGVRLSDCADDESPTATFGQLGAPGGVCPQHLTAPVPSTSRFTVHSDHTARTWDLYLRGDPTPIATGLGFFDATAAASYTGFGIRGAGSSIARIDSIRIDTNAPAMNTAVDASTVYICRCIPLNGQLSALCITWTSLWGGSPRDGRAGSGSPQKRTTG